MRIHQITHLFYPDEIAGASLYTDLALFLRDRGHDVRVSSTFSYYPALRYRPQDSNLTVRDEVFEGIAVRRIAMRLPKKHKGFRRFIPEITYVIGLLIHAKWKGWNPDVIITASPMLAQCLAVRWLYPSTIPRLLVVQDLMANAATELGIVRGPGLAGLLRRVERYAFCHANLIITISPKMLSRMGNIGPKFGVIPNWIHRTLLQDIAATPAVRRSEMRLIYSGNLGIKQGLPNVIKMFGQIGGEWHLDVYGGGAEFAEVKKQINEIKNVHLHPLQTQEDYILSLRSATACLVTQSSAGGANFLPSKLLPALATGTPILAICEHDTPLAEEVKRGDFGEVLSPGSFQLLASTLADWQNNPEKLWRFAAAALAHSRHFQPSTILPQYENALETLAEEGWRQSRAVPCI